MPFVQRLRADARRRYHAPIAAESSPRDATPRYLGSPQRRWFAWHHAVTGSGAALVIVPPFGHEAVGAHRSLRELAIRSAAAGVSAWRIDLDGTGDSAGDDLDPERVAQWCASIAATIDAARGAGATRVILAGVRLGASLAAIVAAGRDDIDGVIAIVPVIAGKKWLREMRALQGALGIAPPAGAPPVAGDEALGFAITAATRDEITAIDLERLPSRPARAVLVIDRDDMPPSDKWLAALRAQGTELTHVRLAGYVDMVADAHKAKVPEAILAAVLERTLAWTRGAVAGPDSIRAWPRQAELGDVVEEPITIGGLSAIVSRPTSTAAPRRALVLLNAGAVRRIGPNRMYTSIARRCANDGALVVRIDLAGLGDSPAMRGEADDVVYNHTAEAGVHAVVAWCQAQGADRIALAGLCSGGYYSLQGGLAAEPIVAMIPINPGTADMFAYQAVEDTDRYRSSMRDPAKWIKLIAGGVDLRRLIRSVWSRTRVKAVATAEQLARRIGRPLPSDEAARLVATVRRGIKTTFIVCATDPALPYLREQMGTLWPQLERAGFVLRVIDGPDHTFTPRWSQAILADELAAAIRQL